MNECLLLRNYRWFLNGLWGVIMIFLCCVFWCYLCLKLIIYYSLLKVVIVLESFFILWICIFLILFFGILVIGIIVFLKLCLKVLLRCFWLFGMGWIFLVNLILLKIMIFFGSGWLWKFDNNVMSSVKFVLVFVIFILLIMFINIFWLVICKLLCLCSMVSNKERWFCFKLIVMCFGLVSCE